MLRDVELFRSRISKLDGAGDLGEYLAKLVNDKAMAQKEDLSTKGSESTETVESTKVSSESTSQDQAAGTEKT